MNTRLDPQVYDAIDELVSECRDPINAATIRRRELRKAQRNAADEAESDKTFHSALDRFTREGRSDPVGDARDFAALQSLRKLQKRTVSALAARAAKQTRARADKRARTHEKLSSKTAKSQPRRLAQADRQYLEIIGKADQLDCLGHTGSVLSKFNSKLRNYKLPHWDKATLSLKVMALSYVVHGKVGQTINLRVHPDTQAKALANSRGPASYMQDAIRKAFKREFGAALAPEFWIVLEFDSANDRAFHVHGAVATPDTPDAVKRVDRALRTSGGGWDSSTGGVFQQLSASLDNPFFWAWYTIKSMNVSELHTERKLLACTAGIRSEAKAAWDHLRDILPQPGKAISGKTA